MTGMGPPEVAELFRAACRRPLTPPDPAPRTLLDRAAVQELLPHRDPFLFIDRVTLLDRERRLIVARYDLSHAEAVFSGHFPGAPVWPGVLQVEAVAQAGLILARSLAIREQEGERDRMVALTHILGAQFVRPVTPGGELQVAAQLVEDGLFLIMVGQCLQDGQVCSAAAVRGL